MDYSDKIMTELDRSECHPEIMDLELDAGTDEALGLPFWEVSTFSSVCFLLLYLKKVITCHIGCPVVNVTL